MVETVVERWNDMDRFPQLLAFVGIFNLISLHFLGSASRLLLSGLLLDHWGLLFK